MGTPSLAPPPEHPGNTGLGALLAIGLFILNWLLVAFLAQQFSRGLAWVPVLLFVPPVTQFFYILPLWRYTKHKGRERTATGILIAGCVIALIYGTCSASFVWR